MTNIKLTIAIAASALLLSTAALAHETTTINHSNYSSILADHGNNIVNMRRR